MGEGTTKSHLHCSVLRDLIWIHQKLDFGLSTKLPTETRSEIEIETTGLRERPYTKVCLESGKGKKSTKFRIKITDIPYKETGKEEKKRGITN